MKKHPKKLRLNRETITALNQGYLQGVVGGALTAQCSQNAQTCALSDIPYCGPAIQDTCPPFPDPQYTFVNCNSNPCFGTAVCQ